MGIDPHKNTHTAVAVDGVTGQELDTITVKARRKVHEQLLRWAREIDSDVLFAVEDVRHVSGGLQRFLLERGAMHPSRLARAGVGASRRPAIVPARS